MLITILKQIKGMARVDTVGKSIYCLKVKPKHNFYVEVGSLDYKQHMLTVNKEYKDNEKVKKLTDELKNRGFKIAITN